MSKLQHLVSCALLTSLLTAPIAAAEVADERRAEQIGTETNVEPNKRPLQHAKGERLAAAVGHYARARSLLNAAIREFDQAHALADPSALLDAQKWRRTLVKRGEELERVLDPQPRLTIGGIKFNADPRLLGEAKD